MRKYVTLSNQQLSLDLTNAEDCIYNELLEAYNGMKDVVSFIHFYTRELTRFYKARVKDPEKTTLWLIANDLEARLSLKYEMPKESFSKMLNRNFETVIFNIYNQSLINCRVVYQHCPIKRFSEITTKEMGVNFTEYVEIQDLLIVFCSSKTLLLDLVTCKLEGVINENISKKLNFPSYSKKPWRSIYLRPNKIFYDNTKYEYELVFNEIKELYIEDVSSRLNLKQIKNPQKDSVKFKELNFNDLIHKEELPVKISVPEKELKNGVYYEHAKKMHYKNGKIHREGGPAIIHEDGTCYWYQDGQVHRADGPAVQDAKGNETYYLYNNLISKELFETRVKSIQELKEDIKNGVRASGGKVCCYKQNKLHREDGPAVQYRDGTKEWWFDGEKHRVDGPAIESPSMQEWWIKGQRHREDGPAIKYKTGMEYWYLNGVSLTKAKFDEQIKLRNSAKVYSKNKVVWYQDGKIHREDGPAVEFNNGRKYWFLFGECLSKEDFDKKTGTKMNDKKDNPPPLKNGEYHEENRVAYYCKNQFHRVDGPAIEHKNGTKEWWINGELHREDGPAVEYNDGKKKWYLDNQEYSELYYYKELLTHGICKLTEIHGVHKLTKQEIEKRIRELEMTSLDLVPDPNLAKSDSLLMQKIKQRVKEAKQELEIDLFLETLPNLCYDAVKKGESKVVIYSLKSEDNINEYDSFVAKLFRRLIEERITVTFAKRQFTMSIPE